MVSSAPKILNTSNCEYVIKSNIIAYINVLQHYKLVPPKVNFPITSYHDFNLGARQTPRIDKEMSFLG